MADQRLTLAQCAPVMTEELRAACVAQYDWYAWQAKGRIYLSPRERRFMAVIEATPSILPTAPPAALPAMYCGADAFEGEVL